MTDQVEISSLVDAAQDARKKGVVSLEAGKASDGLSNFENALNCISNALKCFEKFDPPDEVENSDDDKSLAKNIADVWGINGGIYRDMMRLDPKYGKNAIECYDVGAQYETRFALNSTYNTVNRIVLRMLDDPGLLGDHNRTITLSGGSYGDEIDTLEELLNRTESEVARTRNLRDDKVWAFADLVLLSTLQRTGDKNRWRKQLADQVRSDNDKRPLDSLRKVVGQLSMHPSPVCPSLMELAAWIEKERATVAPVTR